VLAACCEWWIRKEPRVAFLEFDRSRKSMSCLVRTETGKNRLLVKGAVEHVLERSSHLQLSDGTVVEMTDFAREALLIKLQSMSTKALRCLAFAFKEDLGELCDYDGDTHPGHKILLEPANYELVESGLIFVSMVGLRVSYLYHKA
jgi:Ca2+-transporting ATPase